MLYKVATFLVDGTMYLDLGDGHVREKHVGPDFTLDDAEKLVRKYYMKASDQIAEVPNSRCYLYGDVVRGEPSAKWVS
jgi:hypothetical protein